MTGPTYCHNCGHVPDKHAGPTGCIGMDGHGADCWCTWTYARSARIVKACHCGRPIHVYHEVGMEGFTRNMCEDCSSVRCDVDGKCPTQIVPPPTGGGEAEAQGEQHHD